MTTFDNNGNIVDDTKATAKANEALKTTAKVAAFAAGATAYVGISAVATALMNDAGEAIIDWFA